MNTTSPTPTAAEQAHWLEASAKLNMLLAAQAGNQHWLSYSQGQLGVAKMLKNGTLALIVSLGEDPIDSGTQPVPSALKAAHTGLANGFEAFTMAEVQQHLIAFGVELTSDAIANPQRNVASKSEKREAAHVVELDDESALDGADFNDGSGVHAASVACETTHGTDGGAL